PRRHGPERERQDDPRAGPGRALGLRGHGGHGSVPRQGSARDEAGGPRPGRRLHGVPISGRDSRRKQRVFPQGGPERDPEVPRPRLRGPRLRPRPRGRPNREERRRGPGPEPGEARLRLDRRGGAEAAAGSRVRPGDIVAVAVDAKETYVAEFASAEADLPSPSWLRGIRRSAIERFEAVGFPTQRHEEWRFTNLAPLLRVP